MYPAFSFPTCEGRIWHNGNCLLPQYAQNTDLLFRTGTCHYTEKKAEPSDEATKLVSAIIDLQCKKYF